MPEHRRTIRFAISAAALVLLAGCSLFRTRDPWIVPEADTAKEQAVIARDQERKARGSFDKKVRNDEFEAAIAGWDAVIERFPTDEEYTPIAWLSKAELQYSLETFDDALESFNETLRRYPKIDDIRAAALWGRGKTLDRLKDSAAAQKTYQQLVEEFAQSPEPGIRQLVANARMRIRITQ